MICKHEEKIPIHCEEEMKYKQKGNFRKIDVLVCENCKEEIPMPKHCGVPMLYVDEDYYPVYDLNENEILEMKKAYEGES
ncbi:hypothetical protein B6F84_04380 [Acidianus manzaensis]|uniref:Uncharacterized protein n=2 Tax=Acidianus manzaensis TaxID=282676 RepID=A0A1W6K3D8_9CREN|nr:hypothetical protein B6F84_04380 [Acidianus manzaensis]